MGKITEYNDLSLDEKLSYWEDYLERLVAYSMSRRQIPMREELTREIVRIRKIIEVFNPSIPNMYMESKMGVGYTHRAISKSYIKDCEEETSKER